MSNRRHHRKASYAFTLAELLIALAILGVIATFTIPKVLQAQQDERFNAIAKEAAATVSSAYQLYLQGHGSDPNMDSRVLTNYMNYVKVDTACTVDSNYGYGAISGNMCLQLHNGAYIYFWGGMNFAGSATTNAIFFDVDPDGKVTDGTTNGPGKSVNFALYYNQRLTTAGNREANTKNSYGTYGPDPTLIPPWFHWN